LGFALQPNTTIGLFWLRNAIFLVALSAGALAVLYFSRQAAAANITWNGLGGDNNWSSGANWVGGAAPGSGDVAIFDGTSSKNATIDVSIIVGGIQIDSGYSGTITQASGISISINGVASCGAGFCQNGGTVTLTIGSFAANSNYIQSGGVFNAGSEGSTIENFTQSGGSFNGGNGTIHINQRFTLSGTADFTSTTGTLFINGDFDTSASGASFTNNGGTVTFTGPFFGGSPGNAVPIHLKPAGEIFHNVNFNLDDTKNCEINGGPVIIEGTGSLALNDGVVRNGSIEVQAPAQVTVSANFDGGGISPGTLLLTGGAGRTVTFAAGVNLINVDLNALGTSINTMGSGTLNFPSLQLHNGIINQGGADFFINGNYDQFGGTFNGSSNQFTENNNFNQSGGSFNGGSGDIHLGTVGATTLTLSGNAQFKSTSGTLTLNSQFQEQSDTVTFTPNGGIVSFVGPVFFNPATIELKTGGETFNDVNFTSTDGLGWNLTGPAGAPGIMIVQGNLALNDGSIVNGTLQPRGNMTVANTFDGGTTAVTFSGAADQTFTNSGGANPSGTWTVDKTSGTVTAATSLILGTSQLQIASSSLYLNNVSNLTCGALTIGVNGRLVNDSSTTITLGSDAVNNGIINLQSGGGVCPSPKTILLRSSPDGTQRHWSGTGHYDLVNVDVKDQGGVDGATPAITVFNGKNSGNNNTNWTFDKSCPIKHVILVWFENREITQITPSSAPFFSSLSSTFAKFSNYFGVQHPSQPNYLDAFSGSNQGVTDDDDYTFGPATDNLAKQLTTAGKQWRVYAQDYPGNCFDGDTNSGGVDGPGQAGTYVRHHNAAMSFQSVSGNSTECAKIQPLANFDPTVDFAVVLPNLTNDMHDGTIAQGDTFLHDFVPLVTSSPDFANTLLIVAFDEGVTNLHGGGHLYAAAAAPWLNNVTVTSTYDHFSLLRTIEDIFALPYLGSAATANPITEIFSPPITGPPAKLGFTVQPGDSAPATPISPAVQVAIQDADGDTIRTATDPVTIAIGNNPSGGTLSGTLTVNASNGVATFSDLSIDQVGNGYTLTATSGSLTSATSNSFTVFNPFVVTNTNDSGLGSLRFAVQQASAVPGTHVTFNIPGTAPFLINLASEIDVTGSIVIDGTSQPGYSGSPIVELIGASPNLGNGKIAIQITFTAGGTTIKGLSIVNSLFGIAVNSENNIIQGNYIGVDTTGTGSSPAPNRFGIEPGNNNLIGGGSGSERNVIAGNTVDIDGGTGNIITGNYIGTAADGATTLGRGEANLGHLNTFTNNVVTFVLLGGSGNLVKNNLIGLDATGTIARPTNDFGIQVAASGVGNRISENRIFAHSALGIKLGNGFGSTPLPNDPQDRDHGANQQQNYPVLTSAVSANGSTTVVGTLNSSPSSTFTLEFFSSPSCNASGNGEGETFLAARTVTTDSGGIVGFSAVLPVSVAALRSITATATDAGGNTSEFSRCTPVDTVVSISGHLTDANNNLPLAHAVVKLSGAKSDHVLTDHSGNYVIRNVPSDGNYTVVPSLANYIFAPPNRTYSNPLTDQTNQDFVGTRNNLMISGTVKSQLQATLSPLSGVTVTLSGAAAATTTTDNNGSYSFKNLMAGGYTVTPGKQGFTMTPTSVSFPLTNGDKIASFTAQISLTGRIVFTGNGQLKAMNADGSGLVNLLTPFDFDPALSRDGQRIAFVQRTNDLATEETFVANYDGSGVMRLTNNNVSDIRPAWSPDGTKIAFIRDGSTLLVMNSDGTSQTTLPFAGNGQDVSSPTWSPDGTKIAFEMSAKIFHVDYPSGNNLTLLTSNGMAPDWSPDGNKIVFLRNASLFTMNAADGSNQSQVIASVGSTEPIWSPDSSQFAYAHLNVLQIEVIVSSADGTVKTVVNTSSSFVDKLGWSITPAASTATGARPTGPVTVHLGGTSLTFSDISASGTTSSTPIPPNSAGTMPDGFVSGNLAFEIATSATVTPPITVCFSVPSTTAVTPTEFNKLFFMHNEGGLLIDRTTSRDFGNRKICGVVDSLGSFALAEQVDDTLPSITGLVVDSNDTPISGVVVNLTGTETRVTETDSDGIFNFVNLTVNGNYNVEPKQIGFLFNPGNQDFVNLSDGRTVVFISSTATFTVGGRVTDADGNPVAGVGINIEDFSDTITDADGNYTFTNLPAGGSYLITPSKAGLTFTPGEAVLENLSTDQSEVNFISAPCTAADISSQPVSQSMCAGSPASFTVTATGTNLTYQWRKNTTNINGATSATLTFNNVSSGDAGSYDCVVSAPCGNSVTSDAATLTVNPLSVSSSGESFAASGGTGNIDISGAATCSWTAVSNDPSFITVTAGGSGSGNGTVQFSVANNAGSTIRNGTITVAGQTFTVYQGIDFADVSLNNPFYDDIGKLSARGVTLGCGNGNFCPNDPVTREQMAAFILRAKGEFDPPTPASQRFTDVPPANVFYNFIDRLAELQITLGCTPDHLMYCPSDPVKREQMAAFLLRGLGEFDPPTPASQRFGDVPPSNVFYNFIDRLAVLQVTLGCTPDHLLYCPSDSVTRAQMAAFLVRAFGL
jgi:protocatechuate 3,4-dioxygenase beta subunit